MKRIFVSVIMAFMLMLCFMPSSTFAASRPAQVKGLKVNRTYNHVTVKWKKVKGAKKYQIYLNLTSYTRKITLKKNRYSSDINNKPIKVRVRAYNGKWGKWSKAITRKVPHNTEGNTSTSNGGNTNENIIPDKNTEGNTSTGSNTSSKSEETKKTYNLPTLTSSQIITAENAMLDKDSIKNAETDRIKTFTYMLILDITSGTDFTYGTGDFWIDHNSDFSRGMTEDEMYSANSILKKAIGVDTYLHFGLNDNKLDSKTALKELYEESKSSYESKQKSQKEQKEHEEQAAREEAAKKEREAKEAAEQAKRDAEQAAQEEQKRQEAEATKESEKRYTLPVLSSSQVQAAEDAIVDYKPARSAYKNASTSRIKTFVQMLLLDVSGNSTPYQYASSSTVIGFNDNPAYGMTSDEREEVEKIYRQCIAAYNRNLVFDYENKLSYLNEIQEKYQHEIYAIKYEKSLLSGLPSNSSDEEKVRYINETICKLIEYDYTYKNHCHYEAIRDKKGVCEAYAELFHNMALLSGLHDTIVDGFIPSITDPHAWNKTLVNGKWLYTDSTWNDQGDYSNDRYLLSETAWNRTIRNDGGYDGRDGELAYSN